MTTLAATSLRVNLVSEVNWCPGAKATEAVGGEFAATYERI